MTNLIVHNAEKFDIQDDPEYLGKLILANGRHMTISDGYHTMDELYEHRIELFITLCRIIADNSKENGLKEFKTGRGYITVWRSKLHHDGTNFDGWFILGIGKEKGEQITYHLPLNKWEETEFAEILVKAPDFDGHTSQDVLERLKNI